MCGQKVETYDLSPDWEFLADKLQENGYPELADRARNEDLSKQEVYGKVLAIIG